MLEFADSPAVVGRDREVAAIAGLLDAASGGTPAVLLIGGDAGIGKSALVEQAALLAGNLSRHLRSHPVPARCRGATPVLDRRATDPPRPARPELERLAGLGRDGYGTSAMPAGELFDLLRQCVNEVASVGAVLLIIENMHWSEQSTRDFITAFAGSVAGPVILAVTFRTDDLHRRHPFRSCLLTRLSTSRRLDLGVRVRFRHRCSGRPRAPSRSCPGLWAGRR